MKIGIVGVSGYGGSELLRLCAGHPSFEIAYVGGESTAGQALAQRFPALGGHAAGKLVIQPFAPGESRRRRPAVRLPAHRQVARAARARAEEREDRGRGRRSSLRRGLDLRPHRAARAAREDPRAPRGSPIPGCYPAAALLALAPLVKEGLVEPEGIVIDAKSGVTGTGRGGASDFGYAETNEDLFAYGLEAHPHVPEMEKALAQVGGTKSTIAFTPHLVPMTRGILATCYARPRGTVTAARLYEAAQASYQGEPFVRVMPAEKGRSAHTGWATGSNLAFLTYAVNAQTGLVVALGAIDNLGKGASAQAVQNANLMTGQPETAGLAGLPLWP